MNYHTTYYMDLRKMEEFGKGLLKRLREEHKETCNRSVTYTNFQARLKKRNYSLHDAIHTEQKKNGQYNKSLLKKSTYKQERRDANKPIPYRTRTARRSKGHTVEEIIEIKCNK